MNFFFYFVGNKGLFYSIKRNNTKMRFEEIKQLSNMVNIQQKLRTAYKLRNEKKTFVCYSSLQYWWHSSQYY